MILLLLVCISCGQGNTEPYTVTLKTEGTEAEMIRALDVQGDGRADFCLYYNGTATYLAFSTADRSGVINQIRTKPLLDWFIAPQPAGNARVITARRENGWLHVSWLEIDGTVLSDLPVMPLPIRTEKKEWTGAVILHGARDINRDGVQDFILSVSAEYELQPRLICVVNGRDGSTIWEHHTGSIPLIYDQGRSMYPHVLTLEDGTEAALVGTKGPANGMQGSRHGDDTSCLFLLDLASGELIWHKEMGGEFTTCRILAVGQCDTDAAVEVAVSVSTQMPDNDSRIEIVELETGSTEKELRLPNKSLAALAGDFDNDGLLEYAYADRYNSVHSLDHDLKQSVSFKADSFTNITRFFRNDFNNDGKLDIIVEYLGKQYQLVVLNDKLDTLAVIQDIQGPVRTLISADQLGMRELFLYALIDKNIVRMDVHSSSPVHPDFTIPWLLGLAILVAGLTLVSILLARRTFPQDNSTSGTTTRQRSTEDMRTFADRLEKFNQACALLNSGKPRVSKDILHQAQTSALAALYSEMRSTQEACNLNVLMRELAEELTEYDLDISISTSLPRAACPGKTLKSLIVLILSLWDSIVSSPGKIHCSAEEMRRFPSSESMLARRYIALTLSTKLETVDGSLPSAGATEVLLLDLLVATSGLEIIRGLSKAGRTSVTLSIPAAAVADTG